MVRFTVLFLSEVFFIYIIIIATTFILFILLLLITSNIHPIPIPIKEPEGPHIKFFVITPTPVPIIKSPSIKLTESSTVYSS